MSEDSLGSLIASVDARLARGESYRNILDEVLRSFEASVGTIHRWNPVTHLLELQEQIGLPDVVRAQVERIPLGKGMAGIAAERRAPVQVCNLQTDDSGVVRPAARETRVEGSIATPMLVGGELRGVLGIAKPIPYEFDSHETDCLEAIATRLGQSFVRAST